MIKTEILENGFVRTYTDNTTKRLQKVGTTEVYDDAVDIPDAGFEYVEVDAPEPEPQEVVNE